MHRILSSLKLVKSSPGAKSLVLSNQISSPETINDCILKEMEMSHTYIAATVQCIALMNPNLPGFANVTRQLGVEHSDRAQGWIRYLRTCDYEVSMEKFLTPMKTQDLNDMKEGSAGELLLHALNQAVEKEEELFDWYFQQSNKLKAAGDSAGFSAIVKILQINRVTDLLESIDLIKSAIQENKLTRLDEEFSSININPPLPTPSPNSKPMGQCPMGFA
ncbi:uncharacterized protein LOC111711159 [Eurytemora carolleeae]|uniref:uncharacterized protein LOC111711159 n=1 Tax=Eurytemora carolleeae TaxID=1294199 RepID=UPI000C793A55|nr:uncharacterized protein LOC111711159 [Eurytemora carolleeae]|eukprot:XP_023341199.1 uncharacterized protein LOC111711159 [Eurytemora affinis]